MSGKGRPGMTRREVLASAVGLARPMFAAESDVQASAKIRRYRLPQGGIQPQIVTDERGVIHAVYYAGDPLHGDVFYARSTNGGAAFSTGLQVNRTGSALAAGTIRGAQIALGAGGRVHVVWNGSSEADLRGPVNPDSGRPGSPMLFTRLNDKGTGFEPERNLMHHSFGLDGGASIAADGSGNVFAAWHGFQPI